MNAKSATKDKPGRGYTYEQGFKLSNVFSANLRKKFKIKDGDAVAVMLPNIPDYPIVAMGILGAGGVITSINPIYTAHEVQRQLTSSNAKIIVTIPEITDVVKNALKMAKLDLPIIVIRSDETAVPEGTIAFNELSENVNVDLSCLKEVRRTAKDLCFLPYSSGTTGVPKGVQLTNANIVSNCDQINEPIIKSHNETTDSHQDAVMSVLPFFHIYGASVIMFHKMSHGIKLVTLAKFQPEPFLTALEKYKTNIIFVAPPIVLLMASHPASTPATFQYLETIINGAAPLAASDAERLFDKAKRTFDFRQGYGLTETSPVVSLTPKGLDNYACVGVALPSTDLKIVDKDLNTLGPNEKGELLIRGPQVMKGYKDNDKANKETFTEDGWFRSGDLAVDDAAVIGVPHKTNGEAPKAFIVLKKGHSVPSSEVCAFVKERVAEYKRIHDVTFVDSLPKSSTGKILRRELKEKKNHVWTQGNVVRSPCKDIVVPDTTANEYIWRNLDKWATKTATICAVTNRRYTYGQLYQYTQILGASLRKKFNINDGDTVGLMSPNLPEYPIIALGALEAGAVLSEAKLIFAHPDVVPTIKEALILCKKEIPIICVDVNTGRPEGTVSFKELIEDGHVDLDILKNVKRKASDVSFLLYSSGTTGLPKGVELTHGNLVANCAQQDSELKHYDPSAPEQQTQMVILPMYHSYGLVVAMLHKLSIGLKLREVDFSQGYGLTETSPLATLNPLNSKEYKTVGFALPNMLMRIVDDKMNNLGPNEVGELLFKGPNVMKGYKKNPEANKNAFTEDGWLRTGDLASINEEGRLTIVDRLKELIKVKGYQVPPAELENVVKQHPAVFDAAVIGISDSYTGEKPKAFVVLKEGVKIDDTKIMDFVNQRVAPYKKIKEISFIDAVPKNNSGKILRRVLKDMHDGK
ncbi:hypothetical protein MSG28_004791 [Choristoneura fumiferana]|uniref:Uncharacterized protein n=1 Tax=Choristoneura fumiferana TaxID=7141 RepID=A0ACC0K8P0_CHOFU|nr:hypothetical protein MSG28_004791 [Choristoneura fumiferana]